MCRKELRAVVWLGVVALALTASVSVAAKAGVVSPPLHNTEGDPTTVVLPFITTGLCTPRVGTSYYVSTAGDDRSSGTESRPFKTVQKAVDVAEPGDTIFVRAGSYHAEITIRKSGTECSPITISGYPGERPVIDGQYTLPEGPDETCDPETGNCFTYEGLITVSGSHIILEGLEVMRSRGRGIRLLPKHSDETESDAIIRDCEVHSNRNAGVHATSYTQLLLEDNEFWDNGNYATYRRSPSPLSWPGTIKTKYCENVTVRGNVIRNNWGEGILIASTDHSVVEDNVVYDNMATNIYCNVCGYATIQRNLVYSSIADVPPSKGISIALDWDVEGGKGYSTDHIVVNNIVIGTQFLFSFHVYGLEGDDPGRGALINTVIAHNTFVNANANGTSDQTGRWAPTAIWIEAREDHDNVRIENNIFLQDLTKGRLAYVPSDSAFRWSHNLWSSAPPDEAQGTDDLIGDPRLANPDVTLTAGAASAGWYKLTGSSPAVDAAKAIAEVIDDFFMTARTSTPDIGAHELP